MTKERLEYLWKTRGPYTEIKTAYRPAGRVGSFVPDENGLTEAENAEVIAKWNTMPGSACWMNAFVALCREAGADL